LGHHRGRQQFAGLFLHPGTHQHANACRPGGLARGRNFPPARSYFGGRSEFSAARTVFRATPSRREISLMGTPSARCSRRISAQSSTFSTLQESGGQDSRTAWGSVFTKQRHGSTQLFFLGCERRHLVAPARTRTYAAARTPDSCAASPPASA
jgi:hypothetical protein